MNKDNAFKYMNELGKQREPFLFILDFDLAKPLVFPLKSIQNSSEIVFDINGIRNYTPLLINATTDLENSSKILIGDIFKL